MKSAGHLLLLLVVVGAKGVAQDIDRRALVRRHNPALRAADALSPLTLGNGEFAFTADVTGLQSFPEFYARNDSASRGSGSTPLLTQSQWGWHSFANPNGYTLKDAFETYDTHGRAVNYASRANTPAGTWLRESPNRLNLARIGLVLTRADGSAATIDDLHDVEQTLDLWTGELASRFTFLGASVHVRTWVHPQRDLLAVRIDPGTLDKARYSVRIAFPRARPLHSGDPSEWGGEGGGRASTEIRRGANEVAWTRTLDDAKYGVRLAWNAASAARTRVVAGGDDDWILIADRAGPIEFVVDFAKSLARPRLPDVPATRTVSANHWQTFWRSGAAIDLSGSTDPRAKELERRIVLSQYLMAIQSAGSLPPQETGLTMNSWFGKFHLEMHWWHSVHFALWNRLSLLERSLPYYGNILPAARATAKMQGYRGARWPKMTDPAGRESPSTVGVFLIWQQPHPIYFAELVYRQRGDRATLERYKNIVFESAEFMASYAHYNDETGRFVLGPPLIPAQEIHPARTTFNPGFELQYWRFGLETAQRWRERLGLARNAEWDRVLAKLSPLPSRGGLYVNAESAPETFLKAEERRDHPTLLASCGMLPCDGVDRTMMRRTLAEVMRTWSFATTWGWDYPLIAMTAARVGEPNTAIDALLMNTQKNRYLANGNNYQDARLTLYLPGNGGLLTAVAMMAAGWDGAPAGHAPGFPREGWVVKWEGLRRMP